MVVVYSDGLTEATGDDGEEYGSDRLSSLLPGLKGMEPAAAGACILNDVDRFTGGGKPADDLSLLILKRRG